MHTSGWRDQSCSCADCSGLKNMTRCYVYVVPWGRSPVLMATACKGLCKCGNVCCAYHTCSIEHMLWSLMVHGVIKRVVWVVHMLFTDLWSKVIASFNDYCSLSLKQLGHVSTYHYHLKSHKSVSCGTSLYGWPTSLIEPPSFLYVIRSWAWPWFMKACHNRSIGRYVGKTGQPL